MLPFVGIALIAGIVTAGASAIVLWLSRRYRLAPEVRERDMHERPTPRLGGIAMYIGVVAAFGFALTQDAFTSLTGRPQQLLALLAALTLIVLVGTLDDLLDLDWMIKLGAQLVAAGLLAWQGVQILSLPIGNTLIVASPAINFVLTVILMVLVMNAVNFIDGLDGLVAGFAIIANLVFFIYTRLLVADMGTADPVTFASLIAAALVGVSAGFLPFNWHRARMFMGDSGALLVGLMMATSTISVTGQLNPAALDTGVVIASYIPIILPIAVMALPIADLALAVVRRVSAGKSPFAADRKHLHHRLVDRGHSHLQAASIFHLWTFVIALACLLVFMLQSYVIPLIVVIVGGVLCLIVTLVPVSRLRTLLPLQKSKNERTPSDRISGNPQP